MTNIAELFSQLKIADNAVIAQASGAILRLYQDPNMISPILDILKTNNDQFIRHLAALGLKTLLYNHWYGYSTSPSAEQIMGDIINSLQNESVELIRHSIIFALEPICAHRELRWPFLLDDLAMNCIQSEEPAVLDVGLSLYEVIVPHLDDSTVASILPHISARIENVFQTKPILIVTAAKLVASLVRMFSPPIPDSLDRLICILLDGFKSLLMCQSPITHEIANAIDDAISGSAAINPKKYLFFLLQLVNDPLIPRNLICHVFTPILSIVKFNFPQIEKYLSDILTTVFKCTALAFQDECLDGQSDSLYIFNTLFEMSYNNEQLADFLFSTMSQFISNSSIPESFASLLTIQFFIDEYPSIVSDNLKQMTSFLLQQMDINNHHCLPELALVCISHLIFVFNGGLICYTESLLQSIVAAISCDHVPLIINGLIALKELFSTLEFDHTILPNLIQLIVSKLGMSSEILNCGVSALNALLFAVGSEIQPFSQQLFELLGRLIQINEISYPLLKSYAAEGLARLLKFGISHEQTPQVVETTINLLMSCATSEDLTVLNSALSAFTILADTNFPQIVPALQIAMQKSFAILKLEFPILVECEESEGMNEEKPLDPVIESKIASIKFINSFSKAHPDAIAQCVEPCVELLMEHLEFHEQNTVISAIQTLTTISGVNLTNPNNIIQKLLFLIKEEEDDILIGLKAFSAFTKMVNSQTAPELVSECVKFSVAGLLNKLHFQKYGGDNIDLYQSIFKFLSKVALCVPNLFPLDVILKVSHKYIQKEMFDSLSFSTIPLANYFSIAANVISEETKQIIFRIIFDSLNICDGTVVPYPIDAVKILLLSNYGQGGYTQNVQQILEKMQMICSLKNDGQPVYDKTVSSAVSLLFTIFNIIGDKFEIHTFFPYMLESFPISHKDDATNVYSCLIQLYQKFPQLIGLFAPQFIVGLSKTLAQTDNALIVSRLTNEIIVQLLNILKELISKVPNAQQIIVEALNNQIAVDRLMQKLNQS